MLDPGHSQKIEARWWKWVGEKRPCICIPRPYLCTASLYLEKVVSSKQLKFVMETDVERKAKLEQMITTTQLRLALETEEETREKQGKNLI